MEGLSENSPLGVRMMQLARESGISDFYITPWEPLAFKLNGDLYYDDFVYQPDMAMEVKPGFVDYAMSIGGYRFRVNQLLTRGRLRWVFRLLPREIPSPEDIRVPSTLLKAFMEAKYGLFLLCGPTGSGKTTTIASMLLYRAQRRREHLISFEDPIEYLYPDGLPSLITQREIGSDELDFASSLKASLRQAPDVILVGEIRDGETAEIALQASETGHVVVATLHTSSASQTVQRFLKLITPARVSSAQATLADVMRAIMCQRLLHDTRRGKRFAIHELLVESDAVANLIRRGEFPKLDQEIETGTKKGMINFERSLSQRGAEGWTHSIPPPTGYGNHEVMEYLKNQQPLAIR